MKSCVQVSSREDSTKGRQVLATEDIPPGKVILSEKPFTYCLRPDYWKERCNNCFKCPSLANKNLQRCASCKRQWYCDKACFRKAWLKYHKAECRFFGSCILETIGHSGNSALICDILLVFRTLRKTRQIEPESFDQSPLSLSYNSFLKDEEMNETEALIEMIMELRQTYEDYMNDVFPPCYNRNDLREMLLRFRSNNFGICDMLLVNIGAGVYVKGAILNHSCDPNCCVYFEGTKRMEIRTVRRVKQGEELCHSYIDCASPLRARQKNLREIYGFTCTCRRCCEGITISSISNSGGHLQTLLDEALKPESASVEFLDDVFEARAQNITWTKTHDAEMKKVNAILNQMQSKELTLEEEIKMFETVLSIKLQLLHPLNCELISLMSRLFHAQILSSRWKEAVDTCAYLCQVYRRWYGTYHPLYGLQLLTLGDILLNKTKQVETGVQVLNLARNVLVTSCGENATLVKTVDELIGNGKCL